MKKTEIDSERIVKPYYFKRKLYFINAIYKYVHRIYNKDLFILFW